jgi:hypothetical protein
MGCNLKRANFDGRVARLDHIDPASLTLNLIPSFDFLIVPT